MAKALPKTKGKKIMKKTDYRMGMAIINSPPVPADEKESNRQDGVIVYYSML